MFAPPKKPTLLGSFGEEGGAPRCGSQPPPPGRCADGAAARSKLRASIQRFGNLEKGFDEMSRCRTGMSHENDPRVDFLTVTLSRLSLKIVLKWHRIQGVVYMLISFMSE